MMIGAHLHFHFLFNLLLRLTSYQVIRSSTVIDITSTNVLAFIPFHFIPFSREYSLIGQAIFFFWNWIENKKQTTTTQMMIIAEITSQIGEKKRR